MVRREPAVQRRMGPPGGGRRAPGSQDSVSRARGRCMPFQAAAAGRIGHCSQRHGQRSPRSPVGSGATYEDAAQLVQHPVLGGIEPLHVLLGASHHLEASLLGSNKMDGSVRWSPPEEEDQGVRGRPWTAPTRARCSGALELSRRASLLHASGRASRRSLALLFRAERARAGASVRLRLRRRLAERQRRI